MPSEKNQQLLQEIMEKLSKCTIAVTTNYGGLPVTSLNELRRRFREQKIEYRVVKNTIAKLAGEKTGMGSINDILEGPTAIAFGYDDPLVPARILEEYIRTTRSSLTIRGALMDGTVLQGSDGMRLATLPSREELLGQLVSQMQAPMSRLASILLSPVQGLATVLGRRLEQG